MRFAIVSDTHDNIKNFNKVIDFLNSQNINLIFHCGDICFLDSIKEAENNFNGEIKWVKGNGDFDLLDIPEKLEINIAEKKIFLNHYPDIAKKAAESGKYDLVFYGHTHEPWLEKIGDCLMVNPGELAGQKYKPTFAIYDTETNAIELKILEKL